MSGIKEHQAPASISDDEGYDCKYQTGRYLLVFVEEAYQIITALKDVSLQHGSEFSVFIACYCHQPLQEVLEEA
jgi:hypothetical protein